MTDEFEMRDAARDLAGLYRELGGLKHTAQQPRGERVMRPAPGPRPPGNFFLISLDAHLTSRLFELVRDAANYIEPTAILHHHGRLLCEWLAWNAQTVSELDFADDILDELKGQAHKIGQRLHPRGVAEVAARPEQPQSARSICHKLRGKGHYLPEQRLVDWARRGKISPQIMRDGTPGYLMTEVIAHLGEDG